MEKPYVEAVWEDQVTYVLPRGKFRIKRFMLELEEDGDIHPVSKFYAQEKIECKCLTGACIEDNHWRTINYLKIGGVAEFSEQIFYLLKQSNENYKQINREREQALECNQMVNNKISVLVSEIQSLEPRLKALTAQINAYKPEPFKLKKGV